MATFENHCIKVFKKRKGLLLWSTKIHLHNHKSPPLDSILNHIKLLDVPTICFSELNLISPSHLQFCLSNILSRFSNQIFYVHSKFVLHEQISTPLVYPYWQILGEEYKLWSSFVCFSLFPLITLISLRSMLLSVALCFQIPWIIYCPLEWETKSHNHSTRSFSAEDCYQISHINNYTGKWYIAGHNSHSDFRTFCRNLKVLYLHNVCNP